MQMHSTSYDAARVANLSKIDISDILNNQENEHGKISQWWEACEQASDLEEVKPSDLSEYPSKFWFLNNSSKKSRTARVVIR